MNIEQRIKEIEEVSKGNRSNGTTWHDGKIDMAQQSLEVINHLQSEVERYKSLWETNAAESKEIIAELKAKDEWQPIETASKDAKIDLLWCGNRYIECYHDSICDDWRTTAMGGRLIVITNPTHWKPLPKLPKQNH